MSACRAAVYLETAVYDRRIAECDLAMEKDREIMADYKVIAHALTGKANALCKCLSSAESVEASDVKMSILLLHAELQCTWREHCMTSA